MSKETFQQFLEKHATQLELSTIPHHLWQTLHRKVTDEIFDAGNCYSLMMVEEASDVAEDDEPERSAVGSELCESPSDTTSGTRECEEDTGPTDAECETQSDTGSDETEIPVSFSWMVLVTAVDGVKQDDPNSIYLIDHAWTFKLSQARDELAALPDLVNRMAGLMDTDSDSRPEDVIDRIVKHIWRFGQCYHVTTIQGGQRDEDFEPLWYIMDEFGSRIQHSEDASVRVVPFLHVPTNTTFSVMWPLRDLEHQDEVTRDFATGVRDPLLRKVKLLPWIHCVLEAVDFAHKDEELGNEYYEQFSAGERVDEEESQTGQGKITHKDEIKIYTEIQQVSAHLTDAIFKVTDTKDESDIWWLKEDFRDFRSLADTQPRVIVNQFPGESLLTVKEPFSVIARRCATLTSDPKTAGQPSWLPETYDLHREIVQFAAYYQWRETQNLDNVWIVKPWNRGRGIECHVTSNLGQIIRLAETGPKVVCKYVMEPVLYTMPGVGQVKFDLRFLVLLRSVRPLKVYMYRAFWPRFANKPYTQENYHDLETHLTVMNYVNEDLEIPMVHYQDFINNFEQQYPGVDWHTLESKVCAMLRSLLEAAVSEPYPRGLGHSPQSRAVYGVDVMLQWELTPQGTRKMAPVLLEVNFCPDCTRACVCYPGFYNNIFHALFRDDTSSDDVILI